METVNRTILRRHARPMRPIDCGITPLLRQLSGIRAVLFDVYGTLLISASGEVGTAGEDRPAPVVEAAFAAAGISVPAAGEEILRRFHDTIRSCHQASKNDGIEHPEVEIVGVWRTVLAELATGGSGAPPADPERLAVEYEARSNPTWPMPGVRRCLELLRQRDLLLGIVSNAQFYTPELFPALLERPLSDLGFGPDLVFYSYRHGHAKPGQRLYRLAKEALAKRGVRPDQTLYVGNDMLNDVRPASRLGFRTALFAGDGRSYRPRRGDPRVAGVSPDLVVTDLLSVGRCLAARPPAQQAGSESGPQS